MHRGNVQEQPSSVAIPSTTSSFQDSSLTIKASAATSTPSASPVASSSQATRSISNPSALSAPSNCQSLESPYSISSGGAISVSVQFDIICQIDYDLPYFMGMYTNTFEQCISACASYTTNLRSQSERGCAIATYKESDYTTCWLKRSNGTTMPAHQNTAISVAVLRQN